MCLESGPRAGIGMSLEYWEFWGGESVLMCLLTGRFVVLDTASRVLFLRTKVKMVRECGSVRQVSVKLSSS